MIDAHLHVWGAELLDVPWLADERSRRIRRAYSVDEAATMLRTEGISSAIAVTADESDAGSARLLARCEGRAEIAAVVGWTDLSDLDAGRRLDDLRAATGGAALRGVRVVAFGVDAVYAVARMPGLRALSERRLLLEILTDESGLSAVPSICRAAPEIDVIVDHLGNPFEAGVQWRNAMTALASHPRAHLKASGAVVHTERLPHLLSFARGTFGATRLLAGTDWPIHTLDDAVNPWRRLHEGTTGWNAQERAAFFGANAARVYGLIA